MIQPLFIIIGIVALCLLSLFFSDGFEKGIMMIMFLLSFVALPIYCAIEMNSFGGAVLGFVFGFIIMLTINMILETPSRWE